jgi:diguanylate cyclase (GGDEF)-like protein/PAS domain S-box-containing protein
LHRPQAVPGADGRGAGSALDLGETLQLVADTIVESLGFEVAVVNVLDDSDGPLSMRVAAVTGPQEVREALLHRRQGLDGWRRLLEESEPWGTLRFLDHAKAVGDPEDMFTWVPDTPVSDDPDAWHPEDALFAPLLGADGTQLGMLSVDLPRDGRRPDAVVRRGLEALAVTASLAIEHARVAEENRRSFLRFQSIFASSPVAIALFDDTSTCVDVNDAFCRLLGRPRDQVVGHQMREFTHPDDQVSSTRLAQQIRAGAPPRTRAPVDKRYVRPDGEVVWGRLHLVALDPEGAPGWLIGQVEDVTASKLAERRLVHQARTDPLTSLPNRAEVLRRLNEAVALDAARGALTVVFFCDLDKLKLVNDAHGHAVGDAYIVEVAGRLRRVLRDGDVVGRMGGDEFVAVLSGVRTPTEAVALAGNVLAAVATPMQVGSVVLHPSLSLGISMSDGHATDGSQLVAQADTAMYRAKAESRGGWRLYDPAMRSSTGDQLALRGDLVQALARDELLLHYQPVVRLTDRAPVMHEALLRWQHPNRGLLHPGDFLPVVLDSEHEGPVTEWVLDRACRDAVAQLPGDRTVTVNLSSPQISRRDMPEVVAGCLARHGLRADELVLEIIEDRLMTHPEGPELLGALAATGVRLAVDDYGTGFSGLGYLLRYRSLSVLKLDRSFTAGVCDDPVSAHIVRSTLALAEGCGLQLVVEGVETEEQAAALARLGVRYAQGYLFGRPAPLGPAAPGQPARLVPVPPA